MWRSMDWFDYELTRDFSIVRVKKKEPWVMRFIAIAVFFAISLTGCGDSGNYNRGYVISRSALDDFVDEANIAKPVELEP